VHHGQKDFNMQTTTIDSQAGVFTAHFSDNGLAGLDFPSAHRSPADQRKNGQLSSPSLDRWKKLTADALQSALAGKSPKVLPPLDLSSGTTFQQKVWAALRQIPSGKTRSYSQVAVAVRKPLASRAVGSACGANPIPILVPCHRVLPTAGGLGGFSAGLEWKRRLLGVEGVSV